MYRRDAMRTSLLVLLSACSTTKFGTMVTEISVAPSNSQLLVVKQCDLQWSKSSVEEVSVGACTQSAIRRSPITPVPLVDASVIARDARFVTALVERPNGGAIVTTCRIGKDGSNWKLVDCVNTEIATAPLEAAP
jgi:hypothetical protein